MFAPSAAATPEPETTRSAQCSSLRRVCVLIPAWRPTAALPALVGDLAGRGFESILVVDDGSGPAYQAVFDEVMKFPRVKLLRHAENRGKGRALKTGFKQLLDGDTDWDGVVTADADGQHRPEDIERVAKALMANGSQPTFGVRSFGQNVPLRSRIGNQLTRRLFGWLTGVQLGDTQTGLRGLPQTLLSTLLRLPGERYEYEMTMLVHLCRMGQSPLEVPIATVYLENNVGSHFKPVGDSLRILLVLLRSGLGLRKGS